MSIQGIVIIDLLGLGFVLLILNLIRTKKLVVGFGVVWLLAVGGMMVLISVPPLLQGLPALLGAIYPASALSLLAFVFIFLILIFFSVQISILSTRQVELIQTVAIKGLLAADAAEEDD